MSIGWDQQQMIADILHLHADGCGIDLDPCFGYGNFYKDGKVVIPKYCFDISPKTPSAIECDARDLPLLDGVIRVAMFDPPFVFSTYRKSEKYLMHSKYSGFRSVNELLDMYTDCIREFQRVMVKGGVLIFKCQDMAQARKNYFIHNEVIALASENGFKPVDIFILLAKNRFSTPRKQMFARKFHSYFLVFKKK